MTDASNGSKNEYGSVWLVGSGPGDPGLITARGIERISAADAVVYDRLAPAELLDHARLDAELINVGKTPGATAMRQPEITALIVKLAKEGKNICRLKGGDPFVFGRGGEEALALAANGIAWEVVPGITSSIAAAAYAGIPITHRGVATSFTVITGSEDPTKESTQVNYQAVAGLQGTIVFLMGFSALPTIAENLIANGMSPKRPVAVIRLGTTQYQRTVTGDLSNIATVVADAGLTNPVAIVVGEVTRLREQLAWFDNRPLFGKKALVTRTRSQASRLRSLLEGRGAACVEFPAIAIVPVEDPSRLDAALQNLDEYDWITFASSNGIREVAARLEALGMDARAFASTRIAAVGPATGDTVRKMLGLKADLVPDEYVSDAVVAALAEIGVEGDRILVVRSDIGRDVLENGLKKHGAAVDAIVGYETRAPEDSSEQAKAAFDEGIDITTFTSSSGVDNLVDLLGGDVDTVNKTTIACMGPITAGRARERGLRVDVIAPERTMDALVTAIMEHVA